MSSKISEMYAETTIQDLPDEMLEHILLFLNHDDRRPALQVCRRWSTLKLSDWSSDQLVVDFAKNVGQEAVYHRTLLASSRQYKHLVLYLGIDSSKYELLVEILQHFSHKMETLQISCFFSVEQKLITQMLSQCSNLRRLNIGLSKIYFDSHDLEISPMHKLEELYLENNLLSSIPNMMNITPNITRLHMQILPSEQVLTFLRHLSSQLVELEISFRWELPMDYFAMVCELQFPLLEKLNFTCTYFKNNPGGSFNEVQMVDQFFHQLPLLKEVTLRCDTDDRVIQNLCRSYVNIQFLCVRMGTVSQDSFRAICDLKNLKRLRIENATVDVPPDMYSPQKSLQKLTLRCTKIVHQAKFNSFVQRAFPNIDELELLDLQCYDYYNKTESFELHRHICRKIPSLQRLVVSEPVFFIQLDQFREFCASHASKELRFKCMDILDISENETLIRIPVQKLVLDSPGISTIVLQKLISSMEELRWLEIAPTEYCSPDEISLLREQFPRCHLVAKRKVVIEEPI